MKKILPPAMTLTVTFILEKMVRELIQKIQKLKEKVPGADFEKARKELRENADQGSQITSHEFTDALKGYGIRISMDGRDRCRDNARMVRYWWFLKYEDLLNHSYESMK